MTTIRDDLVEFTISIFAKANWTRPEGKGSLEPPKRAHQRKLRQQGLVRGVLQVIHKRPPLPVRVTLTRVSGGRQKLDPSNLVSAMGFIQDEVAAWLFPGKPRGFGDAADDPVEWVYEQASGTLKRHAVTIRVESV